MGGDLRCLNRSRFVLKLLFVFLFCFSPSIRVFPKSSRTGNYLTQVSTHGEEIDGASSG